VKVKEERLPFSQGKVRGKYSTICPILAMIFKVSKCRVNKNIYTIMAHFKGKKTITCAISIANMNL
jgi:hypothetical protein